MVEYVSAASDRGGETGAGLADQMRLLNFQSWLVLMEDIFSYLLALMNRVKVCHSLFLKLCNGGGMLC